MNRRTMMTVLLLSLSPLPVLAALPTPTAYWPLDTDATDEGEKYHGRISGNPVFDNQALRFDGRGDYVDFSNDSPLLALGTKSFTLMAWVKPSTADNDTVILQQRGTNGRTLLGRRTNSGKLYTYLGGKSLESSASLPVDEWRHVAITGTATSGTSKAITVNLFIDGKIVATGSPSITLESSGLRLGTTKVSTNFWRGYIDEGRAYDRVLTVAEVAEAMKLSMPIDLAAPPPPPPPPPPPAMELELRASASKVLGGTAAPLNFVSLTAQITKGEGATTVDFYRRAGLSTTACGSEASDQVIHTDLVDTNNDKKYHHVQWNLTPDTYIYCAKAFSGEAVGSTANVTVTVTDKPYLDTLADRLAFAPGDRLDYAAIIADAKDRGKLKSVDASTFANAVSNAGAGDVIQLRAGVYDGRFDTLSFKGQGTAKAPIVTLADGEVTFSGNDAPSFQITGNYHVIAGFNFSNVAKNMLVIFDGGTYNRLTDHTFVNVGDPRNTTGHIIRLSNNARFNRLDHNILDNYKAFAMSTVLPSYSGSKYKSYRERYLQNVSNTDPYDEYTAYSAHNRFDHNIYRNTSGKADITPLQIGNFPYHMLFKTDALVDNNLFTDLIDGINSKSTGEQYLFNRFVRIKGERALSLRTGDHKRVDGNIFFNVDSAITLQGKNHLILNNVIDNDGQSGIETTIGIMSHKWGSMCGKNSCTSCNIAAPDISNFEQVSSACTWYPDTKNNVVAFNTMLNVSISGLALDRRWGSANYKTRQPISGMILQNNILASTHSGLSNAVMVRDEDGDDGRFPEVKIYRNLFSGVKVGTKLTDAMETLSVAPIFDAGGYTPVAGSALLDYGRPLPAEVGPVSADYYHRSRAVGLNSDLGAVERQP